MRATARALQDCEHEPLRLSSLGQQDKHTRRRRTRRAPVYLTALVWYGASPKTTDVGYMPKQPVPYSHALHAGELGIDCRYCHNTVEKAAHGRDPADGDVHELPQR